MEQMLDDSEGNVNNLHEMMRMEEVEIKLKNEELKRSTHDLNQQREDIK